MFAGLLKSKTFYAISLLCAKCKGAKVRKIANSLIRCARGVPFKNLYFSIDNNELVACSNGHSGTYFVFIFTLRFVPFDFQQRALRPSAFFIPVFSSR